MTVKSCRKRKYFECDCLYKKNQGVYGTCNSSDFHAFNILFKGVLCFTVQVIGIFFNVLGECF